MSGAHLASPTDVSRWPGYLIFLVVLAIGPVAMIASKGLAVLLVLGGSAALADLMIRGRAAEILSPLWLIVIGGGAFLFAVISATVFPDVASNFTLLFRLLALCVLGLAVRAWMVGADPRNRERLGVSLLCGLCLAVVLSDVVQLFLFFGGLEFLGGTMHDRMTLLKPGASIVSIAIWPAAVFLWQRGWRWALVFFVMLSLIAMRPAYSSLVSVAMGAGALLLILWGGRAMSKAIGLACMVIVLMMPVVFSRVVTPAEIIEAVPSLPGSAMHRLYIWQFTSHRIAEKPLAGWGFDASRSIPGGRDPAPVGDALLPLHPHNAALQVWLELGLTGALLASLFIGAVFIVPPEKAAGPPLEAARHAMAATLFCNALLSFGIWQNWWFAALWLLPAVFDGISGGRGSGQE